MAETCVEHPDAAALYLCDGCEKHLCEECIEESYALFLCRLCGERAMPLHAEQPASVKELKKRRAVDKPYSLKEALAYPFRGSGVYMFAATLIASGILYVVTFMPGCLGLALRVGFWGLIVGLQFRIVRSTAEGENELPDWPDYTDVGKMFWDVLTWNIIHFVIVAGVVWFMISGALQGGFKPRIDFSIAIALVLWLSAAFMVMAYGAVGNYRRLKVFEVHNHVRGYLAAGADAVKITNLVFGLGILAFLLQGFLEAIPFAGAALSSIVGVYWLFMVPHLAGLLFRRNIDTMEKLYWSTGGLGY